MGERVPEVATELLLQQLSRDMQVLLSKQKQMESRMELKLDSLVQDQRLLCKELLGCPPQEPEPPARNAKEAELQNSSGVLPGRAGPPAIVTEIAEKSLEALHSTPELRPCWANANSPKPLLSRATSKASSVRKSRDRKSNWLERERQMMENRVTRRCLILSPQHRIRVTWDLLGIFFLCYDIFWIPLQVFNPMETSFTHFMTMSTLIFWTLDIYMSFTTGFYDRRGRLVTSFRSICSGYLLSWFILDVGVAGSDWFSLLVANNARGSAGIARIAKFVRIMRIVRSLRLVRLFKLRKMIFSLKEHFNSESISISISMLQNMFTLLTVNHFVACLWFWLGSSTSASWTWVREKELLDKSFADKYAYAIHWSMTQFTPAAMEVHPANTDERFFAVAVLCFGMLVFSSFLSSITSCMNRMRGLRAQEAEQFFILGKFLNENGISSDLSCRLNRYLELVVNVHKKRTNYDQVDLLVLLSGPLRVELYRELYEQHLVVMPFLQIYAQLGSSAMSQLCSTALRADHLSKLDMLFCRDTLSLGSMYFLTSGSLAYFRSKGDKLHKKVQKVSEQSWFSEGTLWFSNWVHRGTMRAIVESSLLLLDAKTFTEVTLNHPDAVHLAVEESQRFLKECIEGTVFDVQTQFFHQTGANPWNKEVEAAEDVEAELMRIMEESESESEDEEEEKEETGGLVPITELVSSPSPSKRGGEDRVTLDSL